MWCRRINASSGKGILQQAQPHEPRKKQEQNQDPRAHHCRRLWEAEDTYQALILRKVKPAIDGHVYLLRRKEYIKYTLYLVKNK